MTLFYCWIKLFPLFPWNHLWLLFPPPLLYSLVTSLPGSPLCSAVLGLQFLTGYRNCLLGGLIPAFVLYPLHLLCILMSDLWPWLLVCPKKSKLLILIGRTILIWPQSSFPAASPTFPLDLRFILWTNLNCFQIPLGLVHLAPFGVQGAFFCPFSCQKRTYPVGPDDLCETSPDHLTV